MLNVFNRISDEELAARKRENWLDKNIVYGWKMQNRSNLTYQLWIALFSIKKLDELLLTEL